MPSRSDALETPGKASADHGSTFKGGVKKRQTVRNARRHYTAVLNACTRFAGSRVVAVLTYEIAPVWDPQTQPHWHTGILAKKEESQTRSTRGRRSRHRGRLRLRVKNYSINSVPTEGVGRIVPRFEHGNSGGTPEDVAGFTRLDVLGNANFPPHNVLEHFRMASGFLGGFRMPVKN